MSSTALAVAQPTNAELYRTSTDAAGLCREIVMRTAMAIQGRKYVKVEGWQAIAVAHGCTAGARDVERVDGGVRATGEIRRMSDGALLAQAEGFVGEDEPVWFGGSATDRYGKTKIHDKRPDYAIRAMAQTRAISRACRSAFAHVVVMIDGSLSTTPAEEVPMGGFDDEPRNVTSTASTAPKPGVRERAAVFLAAARACKDTPCLDKLASSVDAASLRRDLERSDPELGEEVAAEIGKLFDTLPETAPARSDAEAVFS